MMPVYNGAPWLPEAIDCVLSQTLPDFELIIIDDGSKDDSWAIISAFSDSRIRAIRQSNKGLAATLNIGLGLARAPYVARQDQDDWMHPERLARQYAFMEANPRVAMVGTWAEIRIGDKPDGRFHRHPVSSDVLRLRLLFDNPFVHSSLLLRADAARALGGYSEDKSRQPPEDYEFWSRIARDYDVANLPEVLTVYREMPTSMSRTGENPFLPKVLRISAENLRHALGGRVSEERCLSLSCIYHNVPAPLTLKKQDALLMVNMAIDSIGGPRETWSPEMPSEAARLKRHIESRFVQRRIPEPLLRPLRRARNFLRRIAT
ncbi:MAG: glycosyltransferase family 2 protein [Rhodocyclaceae bacterium]|nr:glycosyltransferase family 2 protein [Rhodocyclaceae bacterium]